MNVQRPALVFCLVGLFCAIDAMFTLGVGDLLSICWMRKATTALKSFSYLSVCTLIAATAVDSLSHLIPLFGILLLTLGQVLGTHIP